MRYIGILVDKMKIKEGLIFNKHSGELVGFENLGDLNNELAKLEEEGAAPTIAKQVLVLMVQGLMFALKFLYAHFSTCGCTADQLYPIIWDAIRRLEAGGLKVTADGASPNRKFFQLHHKSQDSCTYPYKAQNMYSFDNRWVYFFADPPHLIKTVRNCWYHSGSNGT